MIALQASVGAVRSLERKKPTTASTHVSTEPGNDAVDDDHPCVLSPRHFEGVFWGSGVGVREPVVRREGRGSG